MLRVSLTVRFKHSLRLLGGCGGYLEASVRILSDTLTDAAWILRILDTFGYSSIAHTPVLHIQSFATIKKFHH